MNKNIPRYKYPRTVHLPYSLSKTADDKKLKSDEFFQNKEVIVTLKLDGENTSIYSDGFVHARSINSGNHISRSWVKNFAAGLQLPEGTRVCGENLWAEHTISYDDLESYFYGFSLWAGEQCESWDATETFFEKHNIKCVPVIYRGIYDPAKILSEFYDNYEDKHEGFVVRTNQKFLSVEFGFNVAKFIKQDFTIDSSNHWLFSKSIKKNKLK